MTLGALSYGIAAFSFTALTVLLFLSWRGQRSGSRLILACAITAVWGVALSLQAQLATTSWIVVFVAELARSGAWLFALSAVARASMPPRWIKAAYAAWLVVAGFGLLQPSLADLGLLRWDPVLTLSRCGLVATIINLLLLEQIYRSANAAFRGTMRSLVLGVGCLLVYDLFLYSQAELLHIFSTASWNARGFVNLLAVPFIAFAAKSQPQWSVDLFVSRQVVLYTSTLAAIGAYLLIMAVGGFYVRQYGGSWGVLIQIVFVVAALGLLVTLVMSESLRRHARVFVSKHFYRNKYDYRLEWLRFVDTLAASDEPDVRRVGIQAIAQIFDSPGGVLYLRNDSGNAYIAVAAWPVNLAASPSFGDIDADAPMVRLMQTRQWIFDLEELRSDAKLRHDLPIPESLARAENVRIISPLLQRDELLGFLVLYAPPPPFDLTYEDRDLLKTVGRHVATHLAQQKADRELTEARQFEAYNKLTAFLMHDLKNSVAQLKLIVNNAQRHKHNPAFIDDVIDTTTNTVERMTRLIEQLRDASTSSSRHVSLSEVIRAAAERCSGRKPAIAITSVPREFVVLADAEKLTAAFEHVLRNAQEASEDDHPIEVVFEDQANAVAVTVIDQGRGMSAEFVRERLFRPFDSTKGSKGMGIGAYQVREYVRAVGGQVKVQSTSGIGTRFSITLPLSTQPTASTDTGRASAPALERDRT